MDRADVIIFGGGMIGLALASALEFERLSAILVDPADPSPRGDASFDGRTSAVSSSSMRMFERSGSPIICRARLSIRRIAVADGLQPGGLHFDADATSRSAGCTRTATCAPRSAHAPRPARTSG